MSSQEDKNSKPKPFIPSRVFGTSKRLETEGVSVPVGEGATVKIRRANYGPAAERLRKSMRPHAKAVELGTLPDSEAERIIINVLADHLIVSWEGFYETENDSAGVPKKDESGAEILKEIQPTNANFRRILKENPEFRKMLWDYSQSAETFRVEQDEEDKKN